MSIDQNLNPPPSSARSSSVNESEIISYRAVSPVAVFSLIFGVLAVLCYAHWFFMLFAAVAVVLGVAADRKIQRFPDMLTGRGLAQTGITLGLLFGLTSVTVTTVQGFLRQNQAKAFAREYEKLLTKGSLNEIIFYGQAPQVRKTSDPEKLVKEMQTSSPDPQMFLMQTAGARDLKEQLAEPGSEVHFKTIEDHGIDGLNLYAAALYEVHAPSKAGESADKYALAFMKATKLDGKYQWWVEELKYPYTPSTFVVPQAPVDDGHGHNSGGGGGMGAGHSAGDGHNH